MAPEDRAKLFTDLERIGAETRAFGYIPGRFLQDLASSDPLELVARYVRAPRPTEGFTRLWQEGRLDLSVENVAWRYRHVFPPDVGEIAERRLRAAGFDVHTQKTVKPTR